MDDTSVQQRRNSGGDPAKLMMVALLCWVDIVATPSPTDLLGDLREVYQRAQTAILIARILSSVTVMEDLTADVLGEWESDGGATIRLDAFAHLATPGFGASIVAKTLLVGTPNQIEWAEQIKDRVHKEFDRVGMLLKSAAAKQVGWYQTDTLKLVEILEEKRHDVMANDRAGYFIHDWQELSNQVREMIVKDPRYGNIMACHAARKHAITKTNEDQETHWPEGAEL
jgi:hypothetical protein